LTPSVMKILGERLDADGPGVASVHLSAALADLASRERYLAFEAEGSRYDIGARYGLLTAQLALGLSGRDRDEILGGLVDLLAHRAR
jgi:UTP--glucose-1-phosphate uridylyltransferase